MPFRHALLLDNDVELDNTNETCMNSPWSVLSHKRGHEVENYNYRFTVDGQTTMYIPVRIGTVYGLG